MLTIVVICLKISTFVVSTTTLWSGNDTRELLWFAWKYLPLWYQQQQHSRIYLLPSCCDLLENIYLCGINNNMALKKAGTTMLWFAWKYLPLWYQQQQTVEALMPLCCCDLLENIYLCGINNNKLNLPYVDFWVVICLKISTFVVSTTTFSYFRHIEEMLWFAWKYLPLWYQQQPATQWHAPR